MIDTGGNFDPRKLLGAGAQGNMTMAPPGHTDPNTPPIPNVQPYQPLGHGIIPTVPFGGGNTSLPPMIEPHENPSSGHAMQNPNPTGGGIIPTVPLSNPGNPTPQAPVEPRPVDTGPSNNSLADRLRNDPRLGYGFNPGQWGINRAGDAAADRSGIDFENPGSAGNIYGLTRNAWLRDNAPGYIFSGDAGRDPRNPAGFVPGLPDEADYNSYREESLRPYNQSVASERAAGRPGHSGEVPQQQQVPNYTAPTNSPIFNLEQMFPQQPVAPSIQQQQNRRDPRWTGTQTRRPTYF